MKIICEAKVAGVCFGCDETNQENIDLNYFEYYEFQKICKTLEKFRKENNMSNKEILKLWKQGYSVDQITDMSEIVKNTKKDEKVRNLIKNRVELVILKYQTED